jgi:HlyD family secretion protein
VLLGDLAFLQKTQENMLQQKLLMQKDLQLSEESFAANEKLVKEKVLSRQDERNEQSKLLGKQLTIPQINASLLSNETQQREKTKEIQELEHTIAQQKIAFQQQVMTLQSTVQDWMKRYIITAPITGTINYLFPLQENNYFPGNKLLGYINPVAADYYAEANLPQSNFGKVKKGQRVQLRVDAYPYAEFGFVNGQLDFITGFATDSGFLAHIQLPAGLLTSQHKEILYHNGLKAEARIVTKDMRLPERLLYNIRALVEQ